jgi:hypothetical protein
MTSASAALSVLLLSTVARVARAAPQQSARLEVEGSTTCASREDLVARVLARSPNVRFVDAAAALEVRAKFTVQPTGAVVGEILLTRPSAKPTSRRLVARSCAQATDAVALIIAVTLDPETMSETANEQGAEPAPEVAPRSSPEARPHSEVEKTPLLPSARSAAEEQRDDPLATPHAVASRARFGAHVAGLSFFGPAPGVMAGAGAFLIAGLDREALWSPTIVVGAGHSLRTGVEARGGTASFALTAASLDACPVRLQVSIFEARPCAWLLAGRFAARGSDTNDPPGTVGRPYVATGAAAVFTFRLEPTIELLARAGAGVTLIRDSFEFVPVVFHEASPLTGFASIGVGLRSP